MKFTIVNIWHRQGNRRWDRPSRQRLAGKTGHPHDHVLAQHQRGSDDSVNEWMSENWRSSFLALIPSLPPGTKRTKWGSDPPDSPAPSQWLFWKAPTSRAVSTGLKAALLDHLCQVSSLRLVPFVLRGSLLQHIHASPGENTVLLQDDLCPGSNGQNFLSTPSMLLKGLRDVFWTKQNQDGAPVGNELINGR